MKTLLAVIVFLLLSGCSDTITETKDEIMIIERVDPNCPMKMRCIFYDTIYVRNK